MKIYKNEVINILNHQEVTTEAAESTLDTIRHGFEQLVDLSPNLKYTIKDVPAKSLTMLFGRNIRKATELVKCIEVNIPKLLAEDKREMKSIRDTVDGLSRVIYTDDMTYRTYAILRLARHTFLRPLHISALALDVTRKIVMANDGLKYPPPYFKHTSSIQFLCCHMLMSLKDLHAETKETSMTKFNSIVYPEHDLMGEAAVSKYIDHRVLLEGLYESAAKIALKHLASPNTMYEKVLSEVSKDIEVNNYKGKKTYG